MRIVVDGHGARHHLPCTIVGCRHLDCRPVLQSCGCGVRRIPGHHEIRQVRVWVPGHHERVWVPARFEIRTVFGVQIRTQVCAGRYERVWRPGCYRLETRRVWVDARLERVTCARHRG